MEYSLHVIYLLCIYIMLVLSANLTTGMANLLTMCQAAFYGIGAYVGTYFLFQYNFSFIIIALVVMFVTGLSSLIVSYASVKLKGDYFVLATMGFQLIVYTILYNWTEVTNGTYGIAGIPGFNLFGGLITLEKNLKRKVRGRAPGINNYDKPYFASMYALLDVACEIYENQNIWKKLF